LNIHRSTALPTLACALAALALLALLLASQASASRTGY
jgi:hypothetical protein